MCPSLQLGTFLNTIKRILDVLHCKVEDILKSWASYLPVVGDKKSLFGEQMNAITVLLRTKYKNYMQATVVELVNNVSNNPSTFIFILFSFSVEQYVITLKSVKLRPGHSSVSYHFKRKETILAKCVEIIYTCVILVLAL